MPSTVIRKLTARLVAASLVALPTAASVDAGQVVLSPKGGGFDFEGELKSFDGQTYVLETASGTMALQAAGFDCTAGDCVKPGGQIVATAPAATVAGPARFAIHGAATIGTSLMPTLIQGFSAQRGERTFETPGAEANGKRLAIAVSNPATGGEGATAEISLQSLGTASGFRSLAGGEAQIAMASRAIQPDEIAKLPPRGPAARYQTSVIALDAIAVVVSPQRKLDALTLNQLALIFSGRMTNWSELGLAPGAIHVHAPDAGTGTLDIFADTVLRPLGLTISPYARRSSDYAATAAAVAADPDAIAVVSLALIGKAKAIAVEAACGIVSIPSSFSVKTEEYPFSRRLSLYTVGPLPGVAGDLLRYTQSADAQAIVARQSFVGQSIEETAFANESQRLDGDPSLVAAPAEAALHRQLIADLTPARRLSTTFRFASSTSQPDARSRADIERLAAHLQSPGHETESIVLVGFSDSIGTFATNVALSLKRANQVRDAVLAVSGGTIRPERLTVSGYGPLSPVACNTATEGQDLNRRVEVWVK